MDWKKVLGRILSFVSCGFLLVFALIGQTPTWWEGALALAVPIINVIIGSWKPPE